MAKVKIVKLTHTQANKLYDAFGDAVDKAMVAMEDALIKVQNEFDKAFEKLNDFTVREE